MSVARIDADLCCFAVAAACEGRKYRYKGEVFDSKVLLNKILKDDGVDDSAVEFYKEPEPWEKAAESAISYLEDVIEKVGTDYEIYLTGKSNFRYQTATILPYKGNRSSIERPVHLDGIRQLYVDAYGAEMSINMEADDAIGLAHRVDRDVIVTRDKDLNCIPGYHFDWTNDLGIIDISECEADRNFYKQVLIGDATDNILGLYGVGKDSKLVKQVMGLTDDREMFDLVQEQYEKRFGSYWLKFMTENCELLWILQQRSGKFREYLNLHSGRN